MRKPAMEAMAAVAEKNRAKGDPPGDPLAPETTCTALASTAPEASAAAEPSPLDEALFSLRKPKDAGKGAMSGLSAFAKGVAVGAVGLVAAPVAGAREGGVKGALAGAGLGVAGAVVLPVAGAVVGCVQLTRGILATPEAIAERGKGKIWDEDTRTWVAYDLQAPESLDGQTHTRNLL